MTVTELRKKILDGGFSDSFQLLYGNKEEAAKRYVFACDRFVEYFGDSDNAELFSAPGRTEVGGNHTDHQHGCVLAGSVNLDVIAVAAKNNSNKVRIKSEGFEMDEIDLNDLVVNKDEYGKSAALIRGMCEGLKKKGFKIGGFDAFTTSNVLKGSGLSSSAAFEVLVGFIISGLYNDDSISAVEIAKTAQYAENVFFGKPCGLMDQMASAIGGFTAIDFADVTNPVVEKVDFDLTSKNYSLCIVNTGGSHADLTNDYADITAECKSVSKVFGKEYLREVDPKEFYSNLPRVRSKCNDRAVLRAMHFFADNERAIKEKEALKSGQFDAFLKLVNESGNSSFKYLQNVFSVSCYKEQGISLALALTERFLNGRGACRVHGGGFAGTIQVFIPNDMLEDYKLYIESVFGQGSCYVLNIRPIGGYHLKAN
ncbi:MAG TPA: galactokinase [Clostridiales bacterium]|nr:galactokinase [Clostridiales bacterium]